MRAHVHAFAQVGTGVNAEYVNLCVHMWRPETEVGVFILDCSPL